MSRDMDPGDVFKDKCHLKLYKELNKTSRMAQIMSNIMIIFYCNPSKTEGRETKSLLTKHINK